MSETKPANSAKNNSSISVKTAKDILSVPDVEISNLDSINSDITTIKKIKTKDEPSHNNSVQTEKFSTSTDGNCNLKEPPSDIKITSKSSEDSLSKYVTPVGSMGDLTMQVDKSPNCSIDKNKNEDSGVDSQSLSISNSLNITQISSNCDLNNSSMSSETNSKRLNTSKTTNEGIESISNMFSYEFF